MTVTLVLTDQLLAELDTVSRLSVETAGVLLASAVETGSGLRLLARHIRWVPEEAYAIRAVDRLSIRSSGYVPALAEAERIGATAIWLHTHPGVGTKPLPSSYDEVVDAQLGELFRIRTGDSRYTSVVVAPTENGITFSGKVLTLDEGSRSIDRLWVVGERLRDIPAFGTPSGGLSRAFDRNVRAFGSVIQQTLSRLHVGVVGCGGTGSSVAEQLIRLGVSRLTLVDPEPLALSNVTRLYGSTPDRVGIAKVDVVGDHLQAISPDARITRVGSSVNYEPVARLLCDCDVIFGCTDDNAGRLVLSRLATYLMLPVIDCGVLLSAESGTRLAGIDGRVTTLVPGQACLVCRGRIDLQRAAADMLTVGERHQRAKEGYAPALGGAEPAVVAFTTAVAAAAVGELLERLIGYGPEPRPSEMLLRMHEREVSTNRASPREMHYCSEPAGKIGRGVTTPFLDQTWLS